MPQRLRILRLEPGGDLGEPGVPCDERRAAGRGGLCRDHAERLREDRRHDGRVGERQQVHEMPVLERPREERARVGLGLEPRSVVAETDDHRARLQLARGLEQELNALVLDQLAEVDDGRLVAVEERREPFGVPLVGQPLVLVAVVRRVAARLLEKFGERGAALLEAELVDVDARRYLDHPLDVAQDVLEHLADVARADERRRGAGEGLAAGGLELRAAAERVLELRAVRLHPVGQAARCADGAAHQHVVGEDEVGPTEPSQRIRIRLDVARALAHRHVLQEDRLETLVPVEHEHRQQAARQLRPHDARAAELVLLRVPLLADDGHLVPGAAPLARERLRVDVRARPAEQVPVPEQHAQLASQARWK